VDSEAINFHVFDCFENPKLPFYRRIEKAQRAVAALNRTYARIVNHVLIEDLDEMLQFEEVALAQKFEGIMLRHPDGPYKFGRSTMREHWLVKVKRFSDAEAKIIGFKEQMKNNNVATRRPRQVQALEASGEPDWQGHLGALECVGLERALQGGGVRHRWRFQAGGSYRVRRCLPQGGVGEPEEVLESTHHLHLLRTRQQGCPAPCGPAPIPRRGTLMFTELIQNSRISRDEMARRSLVAHGSALDVLPPTSGCDCSEWAHHLLGL
jgi:hypothetical protein